MKKSKKQRDQIVANAKQSLEDYRSGKFKAMTADEVIKKLNYRTT